ncbi:MAG TPA: hypothetical protein VGK59_22260 [Ohtaekwangia sp.]
MLGLYTPLLILQAICLYHAYRNNAEQRWYWFIIFFPGIGCALYAYHHFYSRENVQTITQSVKEVVNSNYRIEQLEKALRFSDSVTNKINLADAYMHYGRYADAAALYKDSMQGFMADDPVLQMKLLHAYFLQKDYDAAIACGINLESEKTFKNDEARIAYAWALHHSGRTTDAEKVFDDMNKSFTNYRHRLAYCNFLKSTGRSGELRNLLSELLEEFDHMKGTERRMYRPLIQEVKDMARAEDHQNQK